MLKLIMKKILFISFILVIITYYFVFKNDNCQNKQAKKYLIDNKNYCLLTAKNQEQWEKGLMFYKKPVDFDGMIFIFPEKEIKSFWNKSTYLDLDIYWMEEDKVIGKNYLPSILKSKEIIVVKSGGKVDQVVEIIR